MTKQEGPAARGIAPARVLVVGESLVDIVRTSGGDAVHPGGSPLNVAVGLQRLDVPATLHSSIGTDAHGIAIARRLEASGVAITPGTIRDHATSVALATIGQDGSASYTFSIDWDPAPAELADESVDALHVGSIGAALEPGATMVEDLMAELRPSAIISFDPNIRPQLMGPVDIARPRVERLVALSDVVKASDEDLAWLYPNATVGEVVEDWLARGPAVVVVTRGGAGVDAFTAGGVVHVSAPSAQVVDTIGAGDSFMSGLLAALSDLDLLRVNRREDLRALTVDDTKRILQFAARCAALTVSRPGADPPSRADLAAEGHSGA
jgi:fructokinase